MSWGLKKTPVSGWWWRFGLALRVHGKPHVYAHFYALPKFPACREACNFGNKIIVLTKNLIDIIFRKHLRLYTWAHVLVCK